MADKKAKPKMGRPSKKDSIPESQLSALYRAGFTDKQVCEFFNISEPTLNNWKNAYPDFFKSINDWKYNADLEVERSLYERAKGYDCPDTKAQWVEDKDGNGRWEYAQMRKHYPPDPTSMIFWLKNRQPDKWRDKSEHEVTGMVAFSSEPVNKPKNSGVGDE